MFWRFFSFYKHSVLNGHFLRLWTLDLFEKFNFCQKNVLCCQCFVNCFNNVFLTIVTLIKKNSIFFYLLYSFIVKIDGENKSNLFITISLFHHFLGDMRCVQKVSRLKLYFLRQKWISNETWVFFKMLGVFKKILRLQMYLPRQKGTMNEIFIFFKFKVCTKKTESACTKW